MDEKKQLFAGLVGAEKSFQKLHTTVSANEGPTRHRGRDRNNS
jgi:hypothetical protein